MDEDGITVRTFPFFFSFFPNIQRRRTHLHINSLKRAPSHTITVNGRRTLTHSLYSLHTVHVHVKTKDGKIATTHTQQRPIAKPCKLGAAKYTLQLRFWPDLRGALAEALSTRSVVVVKGSELLLRVGKVS